MSSRVDNADLLNSEGVAASYSDLIPDDLYIPPDALVVILQAFTGPLDLLLYLIRRQNIDPLDIPIAEVTKQYMAYIDMMTTMRLEVAGDYLVMSAELARIKSTMLLPRMHEEDDEETDPRAELYRLALDYEKFKLAAGDLDQLPRMERDTFPVQVSFDEQSIRVPPSRVTMRELLVAWSSILERARLVRDYGVRAEPLSVEEYMNLVLERIQGTNDFLSFHEFLGEDPDRAVVVVTFLAILELVKAGRIVLVQHQQRAPIFVGVLDSGN